jgi:hypothetical protein
MNPKMKKEINYIISVMKKLQTVRSLFRSALILLLIFSVSCEDILDEKSYSNITSANFYVDADAAVAAVTAVYRSMGGWATLGFHGHKMIELASDISDGTATVTMYSEAKYDASSESVRFGWIGWYTVIHNANTVMERVPPIEMDTDLKNRILAEAHFLRAWSNFHLVRLYGAIPLRYESAQTPENTNIPRSPVSEVYDLIIEDLKFAEENLWNEYDVSDQGRATIDAAKSLLSIVYLTMAGYPMELGDAYYQLARDKAREVIESRGGLPVPSGELADYGDLFKLDYQNKFHKEKIFFINHANIEDQGNPITNQYAATDDYGPGSSAAMWHSLEFYNSFEEGDDRVKKAFHHVYTANNGQDVYFFPDTTGNSGIIPGWGEAPPEDAILGTRPYSKKYDDPNATTKTNSAAPINVIRYAEVLLVFAEAENEMNGPTPDAYQAINAVRIRANLPELSNIMVNPSSKDEFRNKLLIERAHEFFGENKRRYDLIRTGTFIEKMNSIERTVSEVHLLYPIPLEEMLGNTALSQDDQNPGW